MTLIEGEMILNAVISEHYTDVSCYYNSRNELLAALMFASIIAVNRCTL